MLLNLGFISGICQTKFSQLSRRARLKNHSGCSVARLSRLLWEQEAAGSNPATPTKYLAFHLKMRGFFYKIEFLPYLALPKSTSGPKGFECKLVIKKKVLN